MVSNTGKVRSLNYLRQKWVEREMKQTPRRTTTDAIYRWVSFSRNWKKVGYCVHRIVAAMFIPNPENKPQINHKDWNPSNNHVDNLEWCTDRENKLHSYRVLWRKPFAAMFNKWWDHFNSREVYQYDKQWQLLKKRWSMVEVKRELWYEQSNICYNCQGRLKSAYWYVWSYNAPR